MIAVAGIVPRLMGVAAVAIIPVIAVIIIMAVVAFFAARLDDLQNAQIMLGVLVVILRHDPVAGGGGVARELEVFFVDMGSIAPDLHVRPIAFEIAIALIMIGLTPAAALTLHVVLGPHLVTVILSDTCPYLALSCGPVPGVALRQAMTHQTGGATCLCKMRAGITAGGACHFSIVTAPFRRATIAVSRAT